MYFRFSVRRRRSRRVVHSRRISTRRQKISSLPRTLGISSMCLFVFARNPARHTGLKNMFFFLARVDDVFVFVLT